MATPTTHQVRIKPVLSPNNEPGNNLPKHWKTVISSEIMDIRDGTHDTPKYVNQNGVALITSKNLKENKIDFQKVSFISKDDHKEISKRSKVEEGDILFAMIGTIGNPAIIKGDANFSIKNVGLFKKNEKEILPSFFVNYLRSSIFEKQLSERKLLKGTTQKFIPLGNLRKINIPLPPLHEQHAIVAKIEELLSELENGKQQLLTAQQQLKVYRQSLLKWAFEGKLTNKNMKDGELPSGWKKKQLGNLSEMCLGKMLDKKKNKGDFQPYLRNISVRWGQFDLSDLEEMRFEPHEEERYSLMKGDLIVCEGGEPGRCAIWKGEIPNMKIQKALHRVRVNELLSEVYLFHFMYYSAMSGLLKQYFTGTTIKHLTGRELKKIEIPLPPIKEQQLIVDELESKLTVCDKIEETINRSLQQAESLRQSIFKQAFEGRLVNNITEKVK